MRKFGKANTQAILAVLTKCDAKASSNAFLMKRFVLLMQKTLQREMANTMRFTQAQSETLNLSIQLHGDQIQIFCSRVAHIVDLRGINLKEYARMMLRTSIGT